MDAAVRSGLFVSGLQHYLLHGHAEARPGVPLDLDHAFSTWTSEAEWGAWPPAALRRRVHGDNDLDNFRWLGRRITIDLLVALADHGLLDAAARPTLDFGVGCGRLARWWGTLGAGALSGTDIDPVTSRWCVEHLGSPRFSVNPHWPPAAFRANSFGLIIAISVFTHLPEDMEMAWIAELARIAEPGAVLALTSHGVDLQSDPAKVDVDGSGFVYSDAGGAEGLPDFYRTSFHTAERLRASWGEHLDIIAVLPRAVNDHQDLVLARKQPAQMIGALTSFV